MTLDSTTLFTREYQLQTMMGPNCLRILDELLARADLPPGARVLDLGCGMGLTSMALAKGYGCTVTAADLWIPAEDNARRFAEADLADRVTAVHCEARALPFEPESFDAVVSIDAWHYFAADSAYLSTHLLPMLRPGGCLVVAIPGLRRPFERIPDDLRPYWVDGMNFCTLSWWRELWLQCTGLTVRHAFDMQCHGQAWAEWLESDNEHAKTDVVMMDMEGGRYFATHGLIGEKLAW
ncbi:cyclopropane fatty-acyl-phospholipid synthase-like methyltransferase [Desulfomicrobium macestii]|uniref:Cyclopropane fatty-acyl-phospholipid synthase-like methyltransferase n=1 Tax=Desulfomicrobium macestii TaxID=90731 RepID=A0ABR9GYE5_9BACT|nr:methyltransferase domain-containing protein [Desulfomicrobium macestii]MBE1423477.1 cyclopropane fatty-acyl-phospholipid synthase-like methyltransferase [Desulfomicrobium macestii]